MSQKVHAVQVHWSNGQGFAVYYDSALRLRKQPSGFDGALNIDFVPGEIATLRYYGANPRDMTQEEKDNLTRRLVAMSEGAQDAWEERSPALVVILPETK